jgi:HSP20 family molecular chaperone IbpA
MRMSDRDKSDVFAQLIDIMEGAKELYDDNQDVINSVMGDNEIALTEEQPLAQAERREEKAIISIETKANDVGEMEFRYDVQESSLYVDTGGYDVKVMLPEDAKPNKLDTKLNNGVLTIEIPRETTEEE